MSGRPVALVTGASSGIGAEFAERLAGDGYDLVLVARRRERLLDAAGRLERYGASTEVLECDLSDRGDLQRAVQRAAAGDVDLLIANAGAGGYRPLDELSIDEVDGLWTLDALAPILLTRAVLPGMIARRSGGVIVTASSLAFSAGLDLGFSRSVYVGAKSATLAFVRTLAGELRSSGVTVTALCPGLVATEWSGGFSAHSPGVMTAPDVVTAALAAHRRGEQICVPALDDPALLERWQQGERAIFEEGNSSELAARYSA